MKPCTRELRQTVQLFKALAHPQRMRLACHLIGAECLSQKQLVQELGLPQSSVARLLEPLRQCGLVVAERVGTELHIRVQEHLLGPMLDLIHEWLLAQAALEDAGEVETPPLGGKPARDAMAPSGKPPRRDDRRTSVADQPAGRASP